ncbi:MAG: restriction endonuclease subunit S [Candidatus Micrarchaeota archaeon]|nr:restriction endonuclease subunit S [Candidatus Micrarchaeota archaeon]
MTNWKEDTISECVSINPKRELKKNDVAKYVSMADITANQKSVTYYVERKFYGGSKFQNGDTLLARISPCLENGKTAYVDFLKNGEIAWGSTEFIVLSGKDGKSINEFVYYLAKSSALRNVAIRSMSGTSGRQRVQEKVFANEKITIPPLPEQHSIAKILSDFDARIDLNRQMNKTLEEMAQTIFKHWFVDFEFLDEKGRSYKSSGGKMVESELGEIPEGWEVTSLAELHDSKSDCVITGPFGSNLHSADYRNTGVPLILVKHVKNGQIVGSDMPLVGVHKFPEMNRYLLNYGDIVFTRVAVVGESAIIRDRNTAWMISGQMLRVRADKTKINPQYLAQVFKQSLFIDMVNGYAVGSTRPSLNTKLLLSFRFVAPPIDMQKKFSQMVEKLFSKYEYNLNENDNITQLRGSLLPKLMSGKIRVN